MVTRIYDRPDLDQRRGLPALYVSGTLPSGKPGAAYEGRLQIHNAVGACAAEQIDGDTLPPGHSIYVDNSTAEVVITWPAYVEQAAPIQNPGFENGIAGWSAGAGWSVTTNNAITGSQSAVYQRNGGSSVISSQSRYPVNPGVPISAECWVRQGASSAGNAGAGLRLEFRDGAGDVIGWADGNYVMSASKNAVYPSNVNAVPPVAAATVNVAGVGVRHRENKDVWIDSFSWNHKIAAVGIGVEATLQITLRVRDSAGQSALWSGIVSVVDWTPENLGAKFWLDDTSGVVESPSASLKWADKTANAWDATQLGIGAGTVSFVHGELNGNRVVRFIPPSSLSLPVGAQSFASGVRAAWIFAVARTRVLNDGRFVINFENGILANSNNRLAIVLGDWTGASNVVQALTRRLDADVREDLISPQVPVGQWVMCLVTADYVERKLSLYINGALSASKSPAWSGSGPTSATDSIRVTVGAAVINSGSSAGGIANFLDGDIACLIGGSGDSLPPAEDFNNLFKWYSERYGLPLA
ncbi:hypothetical protein [Stenotrophomonas acidaminiphila]|uniref:hypothetical protein n=1 Tax=Stenotrophomonas acidaminiphila TaxID=128780 RepID=UPI0028ABE016|nr:hypothetical protein [Stenotrophomonas acidaminiphila]